MKSKQTVVRRKPGASGRRLPVAERRAEILLAAEALFRKRPYDRIGIADVAKAAGITQGLLYHYFPSKEALFGAAMEAKAGELLLASFPDPHLPVAVQFERGVRGYLDYVEAHRVEYYNLFRGPASTRPELLQVADRTRNAIIEHVVTVLGLAGRHIPATRLSLRGYIGYVEAATLDWLQAPSVARETLERLIFTAITGALATGMQNDPDVPLTAAQLVAMDRSFRRHFKLS